MAQSKPISYSQIAEPNLLDPLKKELEQVNKLLGITEDNLKSVVIEAAKVAKQTPLDSFSNLEKVEKGIQDATKAIKGLDKIEKDRLKLQERLTELDDDRVKANFDLREQIRLQTKELRDNAKAAAASGDAYEQLKKETNDAQKEAKRLSVEFGENSNQANEAVKRFEDLDDQLSRVNKRMRDGRRDVGLYEKGTKQLTRAFKAFASATIVLKSLELIQNAVSQNSEGAAEFQKIWVRVTATFQVVGSRLADAFKLIQVDTNAFVVNLQLQFAKITNVFKGNSGEVEKLQKEYDNLKKESDDLKKESGGLSSIFSGLGAEIQDLIDKNVEAVDKTLEYRKAIVANQEALANQIQTQREAQAAFEDDSTSLEEQIMSGIRYRESLRETQKIEAEIAKSRQRIAELNAQANPFSLEARENLATANSELSMLLADQIETISNVEKEIQKLRNDTTELSLDFYIDDAQNRIDTNQRIIDDETQTFKRRRELLNQNDREREEANNLRAQAFNDTLQQQFEKEVRLLEERINRQEGLEKEATKRQLDLLKERGASQIDFEKILRLESSESVLQEVKNAQLSEQLAIRALEIIRERRTEIQDNAEAQRDLNRAESESNLLLNDTLLQQEALNKLQKEGVDLESVLNELSDKRLQNDIDNLKSRLIIAEVGSAEFISLNQELNDKLIEQDQKRLEKEKKIEDERKKAREKSGQAAQASFELLNELATKRSDSEIEAIDSEIEAQQRKINRLSELAAEGDEDAQNNIALTQQRQDELELRRQRQLERQQRQELAFTAIQTYTAKVEANDPSPLASTISDISVLRAFVDSLPGFYEGSEKVSDDLIATVPGKDGHVIRVDGSERILTGQQNSLVGNMSNMELAMLANKSKNEVRNVIDSQLIVSEIRELKQVTKNKPTYLGMDYDPILELVTRKVQKANKLEKIHRKTGGIWG